MLLVMYDFCSNFRCYARDVKTNSRKLTVISAMNCTLQNVLVVLNCSSLHYLRRNEEIFVSGINISYLVKLNSVY